MSSEIKADKWSPASGTSATIGDSGDTFTVPSGVTLDTSSSTLTLPSSAITGQTAITSLADTDKFLVSDASDSGNLKYVEKQYLPSGGLVFIDEVTAPSDVGSVILDNVFTATYQNYLLIGEMTPANNNVEARFVFRTGGSSGSDLTASEYAYSFVLGKADVSSYNSTQATGAASCGFAPDVNADSTRMGVRLAWTVFDPVSTIRTTIAGTGKYTQSDANFASIVGGCDYKGSTSITGIKFYFSSGNLSPAHFRVYGIVNS